MEAKETQRLLQIALQGTEDDLGVLLERLRARLVLWCAARMSASLKANLDPEDASQEILMAVAKDFHTYRGPAEKPFFKWFFVIADHKLKDLVDFYGAKKRQRVEPVSFSQTSPSQAAARLEMVTRLHRAISQLPDDHRTVMQLYKIEGRDAAEVAAVMGRSENAVRILYCRALKELRGMLEPSPRATL